MTSLTLTRSYPVPPERVWRAFTDPAELTAWFWPARLDPVVTVSDSGFRIEARAGGFAVNCRWVSRIPLERLEFTWYWDAAPAEETLVVITLTATEKGTDLMLVHSGFPTEDDRVNHETGWYDCLSRLTL